MKKLFFFLAFLFSSIQLIAQTTPGVATTRPPDSLKAQRIKGNKIHEQDGIKMGSKNDIFENLRSNAKFTTLVKAMRASNLPLTFKSNGPITLFAPTNAAFTKLPKGRLDTLMKRRHVLDMSTLITCHAVAEKLTLGDIKDKINDGKGKATFLTLGGNQIFAIMDGENIIMTDEIGNKCMIEAGDFQQQNGLIHVINGVLVPKTKVL